MLFNRNTDKETIKVLLQENKRLKRENKHLTESLDELQWYKEEYRSLIEELNRVKERYAKKMDEFDDIEKKYNNELEKLMHVS